MTKLIAVIHYLDDTTASLNAETVFANGYEGVCLIEMNGNDEIIEPAAVSIKNRFPDRLVITNRLAMQATGMIRRDAELGLDGSWCDNPGITSRGVEPIAHDISSALEDVRHHNPGFLFFGSVAFKTQDHEPDPPLAARRAADLGWIATTSGIGTGVAPGADKLATMKAAIGDRPLAVASGISPENAEELCPHVDWVLVATGISRTFHHFDTARVSALRKIANRS